VLNMIFLFGLLVRAAHASLHIKQPALLQL
jgi:hypothetical protein